VTRPSLCLALYLTLLVSLAHGMAGGKPWPMVAAAILCVSVPGLLRRR
jgi:hypothetical protein